MENLNLLKLEVERVLGRKILTASDCLYLSNDVFQQTKLRISLNTLRRLFNLMKSKYKPSIFTLDLLAKYCGFSSFSDFINHKDRLHNNQSSVDTSLSNFLILLFRDFDIKNVNDTTYINLIHEVIKNLEQWPQVIESFQSEIAKTVNGQRFYFEEFVNVDKLNSYYGEGLRYYLHEKMTPEAQMFGHSLLCFRDWLIMDKEGVVQHCDNVIKYGIDETDQPFIWGRYFASQLYHAEALGLEAEPVLSKAREFYADIRTHKMIHQGFPCFEYVLSEALILIRQYEEALFYLGEAIRKRNNHFSPHIDLKLLESIYLFQAIALANIGKAEKSKDIMDMISIRNFSFLSRKFNSILYLLQKQCFHKGDFLLKQLQYLVSQTGFKKLVAACPEVVELMEQEQESIVGKNGQLKKVMAD